jgi:hypothetical protein
MIQLLLHGFDWSIIMICPDGLLLVVSHLFAVLVLWVGLEKTKKPNLNVRNTFVGSHIGHW